MARMEQRNSRILRFVPGASGLVAAMLLLAGHPAYATFHIAHIQEVLSGLGGTTDVQFVEIKMDAAGQNLVGGSKLSAFNADGTFAHVVLTVPSNVASGSGRPWLMASSAFAVAAGITPDFTFTSTGGMGLVAEDGMVCWGKPVDQTMPNQYVDCVSYGAYTGPANVFTSAPSPVSPFGHALNRTGDVNSSASDFACEDPATPSNNAPAAGSLAATSPCPVCGDNSIQAPEQCDGSDDAACPGLCQVDCICSNDCGNGVKEGAEQCDGVDDAACSGACQFNCSCGSSLPLGKAQGTCVAKVLGAAQKSVATQAKTFAKCVKDFGSGKSVTDPVACIASDETGKIAKAQSAVTSAISTYCTSFPYAVDCPAPCDATDLGGVSEAVDNSSELDSCLQCVDEAAVVGASYSGLARGLLNRVVGPTVLATKTSDAALAKCQSSLVAAVSKAFAAATKETTACAAASVLANAGAPVACRGADPKDKVQKAVNKVGDLLSVKCAGDVFGAGDCGGLTGSALFECLAPKLECEYCKWANAVLGSAAQDCDTFDNGAVDGSCD